MLQNEYSFRNRKMNMTILLDEFLDFGALKAIGDLKNKNNI